MDDDQFFLKQRPFMQQDLITGVTVGKVVWAYECRELNKLVSVDLEITDDFGTVLDSYPSSEEQKKMTVIRDGPCLIVRDVRDFFWPESATSVDDAAWVIDRTWSTYDSQGEGGRGAFKNVDPEGGPEQPGELRLQRPRATPLGSRPEQEPHRGSQYWTDERVVTVGGRSTVLASKDNPLRIKRKLFVVCS
jgi:hypothetical protein